MFFCYDVIDCINTMSYPYGHKNTMNFGDNKEITKKSCSFFNIVVHITLIFGRNCLSLFV